MQYSSCKAKYIGETGRTLDTRIKEHRLSVQKNNLKSALSEHICAHPNHQIMWDSVECLNSNLNATTQRKLPEAIQIRRLRPQLNRDNGLEIPVAYNDLLNIPQKLKCDH